MLVLCLLHIVVIIIIIIIIMIIIIIIIIIILVIMSITMCKRPALSRGVPTEEDIDEGLVEQHLDFVQRQRRRAPYDRVVYDKCINTHTHVSISLSIYIYLYIYIYIYRERERAEPRLSMIYVISGG